jgi:hypothetical protein
MSTKVAEKVETASDLGRTLPEIDPGRVDTNTEGRFTREIFVRLPENLVADDLKEPAIWKKVQQNRMKSLRKLDRLLLVTDDESAMFEAVVAAASNEAATLAGIKRTELVSRHGALFSDANYRVAWAGTGFSVIRKRDEMVVREGLGSEQLAINAIGNLYPKVAR